MVIKTAYNQSLIDIAIQEYGGNWVHGVVMLIEHNEVNLFDSLQPGQELLIVDVDQSDLVLQIFKNNEIKVAFGSLNPPPGPTSLSAKAITDSRILLSWEYDHEENPSSFVIERSLATGTGFIQIGVVDGEKRGYSDQTGLILETTYYYRIKADDSDYSNEANATTYGIPFAFSVDTSESGASTSTQFQLPLSSDGTYDFTVDKNGDGSELISINSHDAAETLLNYATAGTKSIRIFGLLRGWQFNNAGDCQKMSLIFSWGSFQPMHIGVFAGCSNMDITATDAPDLSQTTTLETFLDGCTSLEFNTSIGTWNTSTITSMVAFIRNCLLFNQPIETLDTSNVTDMRSAFAGCRKFNQSLAGLDVSNVTDMSNLLSVCLEFNGSLLGWDTSNVRSMSTMFDNARKFNQPVEHFVMSNVTSTFGMFNLAYDFNQPISNWERQGSTMTNITDMQSMFVAARSFNQFIGTWNVSNVERFITMFQGALAFDQDLGTWVVSSMQDATGMFNNADGLSSANLDSLLNGWSSQSPNLQDNWVFDAPVTARTTASDAAVNTLVNTHSCVINTL